MHAERLTVPRGWMLCDRRAEAPALFIADVVAAPTDAESGRADDGLADAETPKRRRARRSAEATRNLFDEIAADISEAPIEVVVAPHLVVVDVEPEPATEPAAEPAPAEPAAELDPAVIDTAAIDAAVIDAAVIDAAVLIDDEVDDLPSLQATSPLLARAFRQTGPQRSVLTQTGGDESATD